MNVLHKFWSSEEMKKRIARERGRKQERESKQRLSYISIPFFLFPSISPLPSFFPLLFLGFVSRFVSFRESRRKPNSETAMEFIWGGKKGIWKSNKWKLKMEGSQRKHCTLFMQRSLFFFLFSFPFFFFFFSSFRFNDEGSRRFSSNVSVHFYRCTH